MFINDFAVNLFRCLARLFFQTNRPQDAINVYRQVRDFDPGNGDGSWTLGVSLFYDVNQKEEGAREIIQSQKVEHPYSLKDPREISVLVDAYITQKDDMGLQTVVEKLDTFPPGDASVYAALAHQMQAAGKADLQEKVLAYGESVDPRTRTLFRNPAATTTQP
jgi:hypothetical protein